MSAPPPQVGFKAYTHIIAAFGRRGRFWAGSLFLATLAIWLGIPSAPARGEIVERIVAVVNERIILLSELRMRVREHLPQLAQIQDPKARDQQLALLKRQELEKLVDAILIEEEGIKHKTEVTTEEVEKAIETVLESNKLTREELMETLAQEGYSFGAYRSDLRRQILRLKTVNMAVRSRITVTWDEVRAAYQKSVSEMGVGLKLDLSQIVLRRDPSGGDSAGHRALMQRGDRIARSIREGKESFADWARKVSADLQSKGQGGRLGFVGKGTLPHLVETAVFEVKGKDVLVGPIATDEGVYLIYVHDRQESEAMPFDKVKHQLRARLHEVQAATRTAAWVKALRERAIIDIRL